MAHRGRLTCWVNCSESLPRTVPRIRRPLRPAKLRFGGREVPQGFRRTSSRARAKSTWPWRFQSVASRDRQRVVEGSARARRNAAAIAKGTSSCPCRSTAMRLRRAGVILETCSCRRRAALHRRVRARHREIRWDSLERSPRCRSTLYCPMCQDGGAPILHVHADDPEAVCSSRVGAESG